MILPIRGTADAWKLFPLTAIVPTSRAMSIFLLIKETLSCRCHDQSTN